MKRFYTILFIILYATISNAQLLWEVYGNGLKQSSYIFGTHHLISISFLDSIPGIYPAFNSSNYIVGEIIADDPQIVKKMMQAATNDKVTISDLLSASQYHIADSILMGQMQMGLSALSTLKPVMIENLYLLSLYEKEFSLDEDFQMDTYFQKVAKYNGKRLFSLETAEEQIELLFNQTSLETQAESLYHTLTSTDSIIDRLHQLNMLYRNGNIDELYVLSREENTEDDSIDIRNRHWTEKLPTLLKKGRCFIAVGALHLPGKNGLLQMLRDKGYKIRAVKS